jgi:hypothetical protein
MAHSKINFTKRRRQARRLGVPGFGSGKLMKTKIDAHAKTRMSNE